MYFCHDESLKVDQHYEWSLRYMTSGPAPVLAEVKGSIDEPALNEQELPGTSGQWKM